MKHLFVIIPVYNEEPNIPSLFADFHSLVREFITEFSISFILVDDGSSDRTLLLAKEMGRDLKLEILTHLYNLGPGAAFATGFKYLVGKVDEDDWIITMEGDNTSRCELIRQMLKRATEGFEVIFASPYMYGGGFVETTFIRRLLSAGANLLVKNILDIQGILTVSSFFRLYRGSAIIRMQKVFGAGIVERLGFESMVEMVIKMTMLKMSISEVAMQLDSSRRQGKSKMRQLRTIKGYLTLLLQKPYWQLMAENEQCKEKLYSDYKGD